MFVPIQCCPFNKCWFALRAQVLAGVQVRLHQLAVSAGRENFAQRRRHHLSGRVWVPAQIPQQVRMAHLSLDQTFPFYRHAWPSYLFFFPLHCRVIVRKFLSNVSEVWKKKMHRNVKKQGRLICNFTLSHRLRFTETRQQNLKNWAGDSWRVVFFPTCFL